MNNPALSERLHIAIFGRTNVGKSSLINALTNQNLAIVSDIRGTTADPVQKSIELQPLGPVVLIDTAGIDDTTELGVKRVEKSYKILDKTDIAILVLEYGKKLDSTEKGLINKFNEKKIIYIKVYNKADDATESMDLAGDIYVSCKNNINIEQLKNKIVVLGKTLKKDKPVVSDLVSAGDTVILVTPIDKGAPKGRLILPQQMVIRELVENNNNVVVTQPAQLKQMLEALKFPPALVITDSQVFGEVAQIVPEKIPLTSFSILMARYKGTLQQAIDSVKTVDNLKDGNKILISEGCTHHQQCDDIGRNKIPNWLENYAGKKLEFTFTSGGDFPDDLSSYNLIVHCGGCMLNDVEMKNRSIKAFEQKIPMTNYGTIISFLQNTFERSIDMMNFNN